MGLYSLAFTGGFDLGFQRAGIRTIWEVEIDAYCRKVLERHFPEATRFADVREVHGEAACPSTNAEGNLRRTPRNERRSTFDGRCPNCLPPVDILSGGFPCQDISVAGKQAGIDGKRSGLWSEFHRIVGELRPRYVVIENVATLVGVGLERVLTDLAQIGYDAEWQIISANDLGAPHLRRRIWIVAYPSGNRRERTICSNTENSYDPGWPKIKPPGTLDSRLSIFNEFEKRVGKPAVLGVDDGIPRRVDRLKGLGNAIFPQIAEIIGGLIQ